MNQPLQPIVGRANPLANHKSLFRTEKFAAFSVVPSTSSVAMYAMSRCLPTSKTATMLGWFNEAMCCAFLLEPSETGRIGRKMGRQHLQGDVTSKPRISSPVDLAHPASTERVD